MAVVIGIIIGFIGGCFITLLVGSIGEESKRSLSKKLSAAQDTVFDIDGVVWKYVGQLDIVGDSMSNEISAITHKFKRGMIK